MMSRFLVLFISFLFWLVHILMCKKNNYKFSRRSYVCYYKH